MSPCAQAGIYGRTNCILDPLVCKSAAHWSEGRDTSPFPCKSWCFISESIHFYTRGKRTTRSCIIFIFINALKRFPCLWFLYPLSLKERGHAKSPLRSEALCMNWCWVWVLCACPHALSLAPGSNNSKICLSRNMVTCVWLYCYFLNICCIPDIPLLLPTWWVLCLLRKYPYLGASHPSQCSAPSFLAFSI